jgi:RNA polymerase sigma-70 factor (ECF subfamily)
MGQARERRARRLHRMVIFPRMTDIVTAVSQPLEAVDDLALVRQAQRGNAAAFAALMRRYNRRLYRTARAILRDDAAAEDALQEGYVAAYRHLGDFRGDAQVATWLTRIVVNQALQALRKKRSERVVALFDEAADPAEGADAVTESPSGTPENALLRTEIRRLIERKIDALPASYRAVFMLREVEDLTVDETASVLGIPAATVRSRLFRAKARLRESLAQELDMAVEDLFGFDGERCDRLVRAVLSRIDASPVHPSG